MDQKVNALCEAPDVVGLGGVADDEQGSPLMSEAITHRVRDGT